MARTALQRLAVLHHGFDGVCVECASEALRLALYALYDRQGEVFLGEVGIYLQHLLCALLGFLLRGVGSMTFLPEEF